MTATSAGGVVRHPTGDILIVNQAGTSWSLPKGHVEPGESPLEAARREIHEESGVDDLTLVRGLGSYQRTGLDKDGREDATVQKTIFMFLFTTRQTTLQPIDVRNPEARWAAPATAVELLTHPRDRAFLRDVLKQRDSSAE